MTDILDLLALPDDARVHNRLTKKDLAGQYENEAPTDARYLNRIVAQATAVGVLRPEKIGVRGFKDADHEVDIIPVLNVVLTASARSGDIRRVSELLHRNTPRPIILQIALADGVPNMALAVTRLSLSDSTRTTSVIEASLIVPTDEIADGALTLSGINRTDLWALYCDIVRIAAAGGRPASEALTAVQAIGLRRRLMDLESELNTVIRDVRREKNVQRKIDLNATASRLRRDIAETQTALYAPENTKHDEENPTR